ncbi:hypothetical protein FSP39_020450 [Pinctada imbricata]|uniref:Nose resistant-to-fluoxetine protein N-terminal domain-containing protein n=1 Tax=Pinctada imbricata TaxID=66713 RepID=A0AA88XTQ7_PINIB|nr:hypothetical protein FSP39_020450 [Pinctada imbricata]
MLQRHKTGFHSFVSTQQNCRLRGSRTVSERTPSEAPLLCEYTAELPFKGVQNSIRKNPIGKLWINYDVAFFARTSGLVLDALGKMPPGVKQGKTKWWGEFDQCLDIQAKPGNSQKTIFKGQYCTAKAFIAGLGILGEDAAFHLGMCIPSTCKDEEMKNFLKIGKFHLYKSVLDKFDKFVEVLSQKQLQLNEYVCSKEHPSLDTKAIVMIVICGIFVTLMTFATLYDVGKVTCCKPKKKPDSVEEGKGSIEFTNIVQAEDKQISVIDAKATDGTNLPDDSKEHTAKVEPTKIEFSNQTSSDTLEKIVLAFSVYTNGKKLLNTKQSKGSLTSINGIRFLSMAWVILGHTLVLNLGIVDNLADVAPKWIQRVSFQAIENALLSVDTFFALSGLLLSYLLMKEMEKNKGPKKINWFMYYFHRLWRLTPLYMLLLGIYFCLTPYFSNGPNYNQGERPGCAKYWWTNLLYINNLVYDDTAVLSCMAWSWYMANDMQFYILSPLLIVPFFFHVGFGIVVNCIFLGMTWGATAGQAARYQWPPSLFGGGQNMQNAAMMFDDYYIKPWCRMGPYIVGVVAGYIMYKIKCQCKINKYLNLLLWAVFTTLACLVLYGLYDALNGNPLEQPVSTLYLTTHRTVWGACVCWVIFACCTGNGGYINTLLSWSAFVPLSRLTFAAYLVHPIIMEVYSGSLRYPMELTDLTFIFLFFGYLVSSLAAAFILSLAFESPMMGLEKVIFGKKKRK